MLTCAEQPSSTHHKWKQQYMAKVICVVWPLPPPFYKFCVDGHSAPLPSSHNFWCLSRTLTWNLFETNIFIIVQDRMSFEGNFIPDGVFGEITLDGFGGLISGSGENVRMHVSSMACFPRHGQPHNVILTPTVILPCWSTDLWFACGPQLKDFFYRVLAYNFTFTRRPECA